MELLDTTGYQTFSNTVFGLKGIGYYAKYSRRNKVVSYIGVGANQGGEITLYDSAGNNYFRNFDSAGYRNIDSYRPVQISSRGVSAAKIDTFKQFTFDTTIKLSVVPTGDSSSDNLLAWNSTSKQVVKWAPITVTSVTANGNASATTFTLTVPSGRLFCIATSQNNVSTVQNCAISGTTLTVTTTAAPASGTNNVKFTILYR
ncbi:MAG: hypothetical protein EBX40_00515 [Gammaproteobacteria bacterium]|nr:hypothetical protein [Gammaproteobacteria bacterium]